MAGPGSASVHAQSSYRCPETPRGRILMLMASAAETTAPFLSLFTLWEEIGLLQLVFAQDFPQAPSPLSFIDETNQEEAREQRFAIDLAAGQRTNFTLQRGRLELKPTIHNMLGNRTPMDSPVATAVPIPPCR